MADAIKNLCRRVPDQARTRVPPPPPKKTIDHRDASGFNQRSFASQPARVCKSTSKCWIGSRFKLMPFFPDQYIGEFPIPITVEMRR